MKMRVRASDKFNIKKLEELICLYLEVNCEPSDEQVHSLACSLGLDKEFFESIIYKMLGEHVEECEDSEFEHLVSDIDVHPVDLVEGVSTHFGEGHEVEDFGVVPEVSARARKTRIRAHEQSEDEDALEGDIEPATAPTDDLLLMDGGEVGETTDQSIKDSQYTDGIGEGDEGIGIDSDNAMLLNDGAPALELQNASVRAASRLVKAEKWSGDVRTKKHPPEGLFKEGSQSDIVDWLKKSHKDLKGAMGALNFYINRAGKNLSAERKKTLEGAKNKLRKAYGE